MSERLAGLSSVTSAGASSESASVDGRDAAASAAREVVELLEVVWGMSRDRVVTAPVSSSQVKVLYVLERREGINLRALGTVLGSAPSSVSRMCDRLEALGFLRRSPSAASRREVELHLTARGAAYLADLRADRESALLEVVSAMSPTSRAALTQGLVAFHRAAEALACDAGHVGEAMETA
jgi:DNA-binding MarR family transcriptional regulator